MTFNIMQKILDAFLARPETSYLYNDDLSIPDSAVVVGASVVVSSVKKFRVSVHFINSYIYTYYFEWNTNG